MNILLAIYLVIGGFYAGVNVTVMVLSMIKGLLETDREAIAITILFALTAIVVWPVWIVWSFWINNTNERVRGQVNNIFTELEK